MTRTNEAEAQREEEIREHRFTLIDTIEAAAAHVADARKIRAKLVGNTLYDVEHAENQDSDLADRFLREAHAALRAAAALVTSIHRTTS